MRRTRTHFAQPVETTAGVSRDCPGHQHDAGVDVQLEYRQAAAGTNKQRPSEPTVTIDVCALDATISAPYGIDSESRRDECADCSAGRQVSKCCDAHSSVERITQCCSRLRYLGVTSRYRRLHVSLLHPSADVEAEQHSQRPKLTFRQMSSDSKNSLEPTLKTHVDQPQGYVTVAKAYRNESFIMGHAGKPIRCVAACAPTAQHHVRVLRDGGPPEAREGPQRTNSNFPYHASRRRFCSLAVRAPSRARATSRTW
jgi:hypothetical protein